MGANDYVDFKYRLNIDCYIKTLPYTPTIPYASNAFKYNLNALESLFFPFY